MDKKRTEEELEAAEKHVADEIERVIDVPTSIEAEALLEAAEIEELQSND